MLSGYTWALYKFFYTRDYQPKEISLKSILSHNQVIFDVTSEQDNHYDYLVEETDDDFKVSPYNKEVLK
ncbi:MAG: hypothetical protein AB7V16_13240 [Vulcanibacillus sp.]